ncbi:carbamoyltransferase C-terminal domain-containing protein [Prochlorococcus sp. MIT 0601]|uniref:carbamoyltransferase C-terminal domain-containing protein n=1 Tax=Prochlorococcus sp. MIT 0601 TaxID=1499498 RepID=UPI0005336F9B|nr:carbamoyltransferase C-terminal domain-containing protein [Prochlorococcus sp. MIT 0601]KGG12092.1 Nodulation protein nolO [Prochlorococcus sp. MIT 0601]
MLILGLNAFEINSSAAFIKDGEVLFAMCEERFSRIKRDKSFPFNSINAGLSHLEINFSEIDAIAVGWNPIVEATKINGILPNRPRELYFYKLVEAFLSQSNNLDKDLDWSMIRTSGESIPDIYFVRHHLAHASNAIYQSPFKEGDFLSLDFMGERETGIYGLFDQSNINKKYISKQPSSTGAFYAAITELLGYKSDSDEWKVMALSACESDKNKVDKYIQVFKESTLEEGIAPFLKNEYFNTDQPREKYLTTKLLREKLDCPELINNRNDLEIRSWQIDVATAMQTFITDYTFRALKKVSKEHNSNRKNICLSGGFFMNCVFNGQLERSSLYKNVFISQSPADLGNSIGSAMFTYHNILYGKRRIRDSQVLFTGKSLSEEPSRIMDKFQIPYKSYKEQKSLVEDIYKYLKENKVIAICSGKSEFGERALGARSIICIASKSENKALINEKIKYREDYRPFAPVCLKSQASKYFEVEDGYSCAAMEKVAYVKEEFVKDLPAITHSDGSARLQTIDDNTEGLLVSILKFMYDQKEIPVLINTSFNLNGEPNVETEIDAIRTFFTSGLDVLVISNLIILKNNLI